MKTLKLLKFNRIDQNETCVFISICLDVKVSSQTPPSLMHASIPSTKKTKRCGKKILIVFPVQRKEPVFHRDRVAKFRPQASKEIR